MKKYIIGFIGGLFILAVAFILTVLIMGSLHDRNFKEEIKSWGESNQEEVTDEDKNLIESANATILIGDKIDLI